MERSESQLSWCAKESIDWLERGAQELGRPLLLCQQYRPGAVDATRGGKGKDSRSRVGAIGLDQTTPLPRGIFRVVAERAQFVLHRVWNNVQFNGQAA